MNFSFTINEDGLRSSAAMTGVYLIVAGFVEGFFGIPPTGEETTDSSTAIAVVVLGVAIVLMVHIYPPLKSAEPKKMRLVQITTKMFIIATIVTTLCIALWLVYRFRAVLW